MTLKWFEQGHRGNSSNLTSISTNCCSPSFSAPGEIGRLKKKKMCHLHICRELEEGEGEGAGPAVVAPLLTGHTWKSRKIPRNAPALWPISATIVSDFFFLESPSEWVGWVGEEGEGRAKVSEWTRDFRHLDLLGLFLLVQCRQFGAAAAAGGQHVPPPGRNAKGWRNITGWNVSRWAVGGWKGGREEGGGAKAQVC